MVDLKKLDDTINELEKQTIELKEFNVVYGKVLELKDDIKDNFDLIKQNNEKFTQLSADVNSSIKDSKEQLTEIEKKLVSKIDEIYQDNKSFQKELDSSLTSRMNKQKSDLQVEIRDQFSRIEKSMNSYFMKHFKELKILKILEFIIVGIGIGLAIGLYLK